MQFIRQIFNRLCKRSDKENFNTEEDDVQIIFSVDIDQEYNRHISIYIPEKIHIEDIPVLAQAYAETLVDMGPGKMAQQLLLSLEKEIDHDDQLQILLLDNIVGLFVEYSKIRSDPTDPMVSPLSVFKK